MRGLLACAFALVRYPDDASLYAMAADATEGDRDVAATTPSQADLGVANRDIGQYDKTTGQKKQGADSSPMLMQQYTACDGGFMNTGDVHFWRDFVGPVREFTLDSGVALNESRSYNRWTQQIISRVGLQTLAEECLFGTFTLLWNSIAAIEYDAGLAAAQELFQVAKSMLEQIAGQPWFGTEVFGHGGADDDSSSTRSPLPRNYWDTAALARSFHLLERVLIPPRNEELDNAARRSRKGSGEILRRDKVLQTAKKCTKAENGVEVRSSGSDTTGLESETSDACGDTGALSEQRTLERAQAPPSARLQQPEFEKSIRLEQAFEAKLAGGGQQLPARRRDQLRIYVYDLSTEGHAALRRKLRLQESVDRESVSFGGTATVDEKSLTPNELVREGRYLEAVGHGLSNCMHGMYGTEIAFHRWFQNSPHRVWHPEGANLFVIPSYFKCIDQLDWVDGFHENVLDLRKTTTRPPSETETGGTQAVEGIGQETLSIEEVETPAAILMRQMVAFMRAFGPYFDRKQGADHVVLYSWGRHPCAITTEWREIFGTHIIQLQVEDRCENIDANTKASEQSADQEGKHGNAAHSLGEPSFLPHKDVMIPGFTDPWRSKILKRHNRQLEKRPLLLSFHGRSPQNTNSYQNVTVRGRIFSDYDLLEEEWQPLVSIGGFIEDYHQILGTSLFCLAPRGTTPWTIHLYVALLVGCIPVIVSDLVRLPFGSFLDYDSFAIRWPEENFSLPELLRYLRTLTNERPVLVRQMKERVDATSCWFDYDLSDGPCSPYVAVLEELKIRVATLPAQVFSQKHGGSSCPMPSKALATEYSDFSRETQACEKHDELQSRRPAMTRLRIGYQWFHPALDREFFTLRPLADFVRLHRRRSVAVVTDDYHAEELLTFLHADGLLLVEKDVARPIWEVRIVPVAFPAGFAAGYSARFKGTQEQNSTIIRTVATTIDAVQDEI
ncbi:unnamed protein product [Amoebophrya sp. A25]|nr:unnamed protein product [Amoebophrya sp. A25]|eukprot:GSA25T00001910001.1